MKRKLACFGLGFALAEMFAAYMPPLVIVPAAALFIVLLFLCWHRAEKYPLLGAVCGVAVFGLFWVLAVRPTISWAGQTVQCEVTVQTDAEASYQEGHLRGTLQVTKCNGDATNFLVSCGSFPAGEPGECFTADFSLECLEDTPYLLYYKSRGIYLQAEYQGDYAARPESRDVRFALFRFREKLASMLQRWMPRTEGELEAALLLGDKSGLSDSLQDVFRTAGVSHLLAVSGLHVALLCGIFSFGYRRRFWRPLLLLRAGLVLFYMILTGLPVSVLRAGLVFLLALLGDFLLQPHDLLTSTGVAAVLIGLQNGYAPCDVGFQLSFCAVLGVQLAGQMIRWEKDCLPAPKGRVGACLHSAVLWGAESIQVAFFASLATLPVLLAHGLTTSGVSVLTNLLVVWMLSFALQLGMAVLFLTAIPFLEPLAHMAGLLLSLWLHGLIFLVTLCAQLPLARVDLPVRYTILVWATLAVLAILFWRARKLIWYLPVAVAGTLFSVWMGLYAQRDVVRMALVGASNNPCVVCTQNGEAIVFFRGGQSNLRAVRDYLSDHALPEVRLVVDLRQEPSEIDFGGLPCWEMEEQTVFQSQKVLDGLQLDLYHEGSGNLAVLGVGTQHIAMMAGNIRLSQPVVVDVFCAAGALSDSVQANTIVYCTVNPSWLESAEAEILYYSSAEPVITIRPGRSIIFSEVDRIAVQ